MRAFFRTGELADFMLLRVYDGEDDRNIDTAILNVPARTDLLAQGFALADGRLLPERYLTLATIALSRLSANYGKLSLKLQIFRVIPFSA